MNRQDIGKRPEVVNLIRKALEEDIGAGDVTTEALVDPSMTVSAQILAREDCVAAGIDVCKGVFSELDSTLECRPMAADGQRVSRGGQVLRISGSAASILTAERTALNFLQRMSGIASLTRKFVDIASRHGTQILDTRKTTPTLRVLEKHATAAGGAANHRMGLFDRFLIKDNHRGLWRTTAGGSLDLGAAVSKAREYRCDIPVEIEIESEAELKSALTAGPDWILLDNMPVERIRVCTGLCKGICKTEASGSIGLHNIEQVASTGVDAISLGALTHSARAVDFSLELDEEAGT
jgi:nicotinate-nucleotide pyrophosphorylase (carboxylating)